MVTCVERRLSSEAGRALEEPLLRTHPVLGASSRISRRRLLRHGTAASLGVWAAAQLAPRALGFADPAAGEVVVPFIDGLKKQERQQIYWGDDQPWITPTERIFSVGHYSRP